ncbi:MAG: polysaccharide deacetylase family protein [Clostridiales bacterium]|nr:polysaccharide deacetylase family protein [Clostridiales bacterium]
MKRLPLICLVLTLCCLGLWGLIISKAGLGAGAPDYDIKAREPAYDDTPLALPMLPTPEADTAPPVSSFELEPYSPAPMLALTFDDGPSKEYTPLLLEGLKQRGAHATFFMLGMRAEKAPELVLRAYEEGHAIGGHGYDHKGYFTRLSRNSLAKQVNNTADAIAKITGDDPPFLLRPPYGAIDEATALNTGKAIMLWSIDPRDWSVRDAGEIQRFIVENAVDGGVVILHDIYDSTVDGVLAAIDELLPMGWEFVTLPQLYNDFEVLLEAGGIYRSPESYKAPETAATQEGDIAY